MALSFTVVTSFMASAVQVNAQEAAVQPRAHNLERCTVTYCTVANSEYHFGYEDEVMYCTDKGCNYRVTTSHKQVGYEKHQSWGAAESPYQCYCIDCGYKE